MFFYLKCRKCLPREVKDQSFQSVGRWVDIAVKLSRGLGQRVDIAIKMGVGLSVGIVVEHAERTFSYKIVIRRHPKG